MTTLERLKAYLKAIEKDNKNGKKINAILQINSQAIEEAKKIDDKIKNGKAGKLAGKIIAVKSNINVLGLTASCASKTLEDYKCPYDANVIERIKQEDGVIIGMANCDEFACGWSGETSAFGVTRNPRALDRIAGGSSSGSAAAVAAGFCDMALGSDTGGSIRVPAACCGIVGIKPSYGLVSRYGLIDMCMSFDTIGVLAKNSDDALLLLNVIKGKDRRDATSYESKELKISKLKNLRIGIPEIAISDKRIGDLVLKIVKDVSKNNNWEFEKTKLEHIHLGVQTYFPIVYTEFFSSTRKFDGRRFGKKIEESCGEEVLRRILGGKEITQAEFAGKYYRKALQAKEIITKEFEKAFEEFDVLVLPSTPRLAHKFSEKLSFEDLYAYDALTCLANIAGIPAISIPIGEIDGVPVGIQIFSRKFDEANLFSVAKEFENGV